MKGRGASYLSVDQRGERQVVEQVCEVLPHVSVAVLPQALVVEAVDLCDLPRLVVPSQDGDSLLETNLNDNLKIHNNVKDDLNPGQTAREQHADSATCLMTVQSDFMM